METRDVWESAWPPESHASTGSVAPEDEMGARVAASRWHRNLAASLTSNGIEGIFAGSKMEHIRLGHTSVVEALKILAAFGPGLGFSLAPVIFITGAYVEPSEI